MLPGTSAPTGPAPSVLEKLNREFSFLSRSLAQLEQLYRRVGLIYYFSPPEIRRELLTEEDRECCTQLVAVSGTENGPDAIRMLHQARELRDEAKSSLRRGHTEHAEDFLMRLEDMIEQVSTDVEHVGLLMKQAKRESERLHREWPLPAIEDLDVQTRWDLKAFLLALPENAKALELGIAREEEVFQTALNFEEDGLLFEDDDEAMEDADILPPLPDDASDRLSPPPPPTPADNFDGFVRTNGMVAGAVGGASRPTDGPADYVPADRQAAYYLDDEDIQMIEDHYEGRISVEQLFARRG